MTKTEKAEQKRARRVARNETHPGAFSPVYGRDATGAYKIPARWFSGFGRYLPAILDKAEAVATLARALRRYAKGGKPDKTPTHRSRRVATDVEHHRGGDR